MSENSNWTSIRSRLSGKWQLPALLCSIPLLALAFRTLRPAPVTLDLPTAATYLATLVSGGLYDRALQDGEALLVREQDTEADRAPIYLQVARARYGEAERQGLRAPSIGRRIVRHYQRAGAHGMVLDARDLAQLGHAFEWQERFGDAVDSYERAVDLGADDPFELRRRVIELSRDHHLIDATGLSARITSFLDDVPAHRLDLRLWAIEEQIHALEARGRLEDGATLLARHANSFRESDFENRFSFLEALQLYKSGYYDEAEVRARSILNRAHRQDEAYTMVGWLLGRVVMYDDGPKRPAEALSFFEDVTGDAPNTPYGVASYVGKAEALVLLERHPEAINAYRVALQLLPSLRDQRIVNRSVLRLSLGASSERARQADDARTALAYSELAASLIDRDDAEQAMLVLQQLAANQTQLAGELTALAEETYLSDPPAASSLMAAARRLHSATADTYSDIAQLSVLNDRRAAEASWHAAEAAVRAAEPDRAAQMFEMYVRERPGDPLVPRAWLRIGQLRKSVGDLDGAVGALQECYRRFPRTLDGARALVPLAECYLARTPADTEMAEKTLSIIIDESDVFTPDAPEFSDALFLMGDAQSRGGDHERAIATFEEVLERYPYDPRVWRGRYLLANAYRQSALALKEMAITARSIAETGQLRSSYTERFIAARTRFRELIGELGARGTESLGVLERLYLRHSFLYEADCYFETQDFEHALKLYEEAAGTYRDHPSGLAAYVQIINCHVFLGQPREARAALSRSLVVVGTIPKSVFAESVSPETRADWKRYFEWLGASELF